jgi:SAM-dependent methyltransferase
MDDVTRAVRAMYEEFPYPAGAPMVRVGGDARLVLARGALPPPTGRRLRALDAGCGRGVGVLGLATLQPDVDFLAVDVNRVALDEARAEAAQRELDNVRFAEVDLMTLDGLEVPEGGFDVIYSSGVLHHLSSPARGLELLRGALAPHGVLVLMVYARHGREPLYRMVRALDALAPRDRPLRERLALGRALAASGAGEALRVGPWTDAATLHDVEFVDRYLNVNETSYDLDELFSLTEGAALSFLGWCTPSDWDVRAVLGAGAVAARASALPERAQWRIVEQCTWRPRFELLLGHAGNAPRAPLHRDDLEEAWLAVSPEASLEVRTRNLHGTQRTESVALREGTSSSVPLTGPVGTAALLLRDQTTPFQGRALVNELGSFGIDRETALYVLAELLDRRAVYAPHV